MNTLINSKLPEFKVQAYHHDAFKTVTQNDLIVSRATNHLLRASVVQVPTSCVSLQGFPSQSCFSHAGVYSVQFRVGSSVFPLIAAAGDAALFNMSLSAYGTTATLRGCTGQKMAPTLGRGQPAG